MTPTEKNTAKVVASSTPYSPYNAPSSPSVPSTSPSAPSTPNTPSSPYSPPSSPSTPSSPYSPPSSPYNPPSSPYRPPVSPYLPPQPPQPQIHTVRFIHNGEVFATRQVEHGKTVGDLPPAPPWLGRAITHEFRGWFTSSISEDRILETKEITQSQDFFSRFQEMVRVHFDGNGGSVFQNHIDIPIHSAIPNINNLLVTRPGYTFLGWFFADEPVHQVTGVTRFSVFNTFLIARWEPIPFRWPVTHGRPSVSQGFNPSHGGIDIQNENISGFTPWTPLPSGPDTPSDRNAELTGNPVVATRAGVISNRISLNPTAGNGFVIAHGGGYFTRYLHLHRDDFANHLTPGTSVSVGEQLGLTGQTGAVRSNGHLHFEVIYVEGRSTFTALQDSQTFRNAWFSGTDSRGTENNHTFWKHNPAHYLPELINGSAHGPTGRHHWELRNPV